MSSLRHASLALVAAASWVGARAEDTSRSTTHPTAAESPVSPAPPERKTSTPDTILLPSPSAIGANAAPTAANFDELYHFGRQLFDDYAPETIKDEYEFVSQKQWTAFTARLQASLAAGSVEGLAALEGDARRTLAALRMMPVYSDYADWLAERIDLMETARLATLSPFMPRTLLQPLPGAPAAPDARAETEKKVPPVAIPPFVTPDAPSESSPSVAFAPPQKSPVPFYDLWLDRLRARPKPGRADELMPMLKVIFAAEGLPPQLVWLAEVESSLNPSARSPAGARGLFQLMPATARAYGLRTWPFDERTQPGKSARAAARLLRDLHARFDSWPLALAAYNAGEGRIAVAQKKTGSPAYADIAELLPAETRMYVPKVLATLAVREKDVPAALRVVNTRRAALVSEGGTTPNSFLRPTALVADP
jgi:membrane-bound lytic murein transglycosylase D